MFDQDGLGNYVTDAPRSGKPDNGRDEMDEKDQEIAHCRIVARKPKTRGIQDKLPIRMDKPTNASQRIILVL